MKRFFLAFGILLVCLIAYEFLTLPDVTHLKTENPRLTALMRQREREAQARGKKARRSQIWVPSGAISNYLKTAILIAEDDAFYQHDGYDVEQIKESFIKNWEKQGFARGASTITQQLAKNLYLSTSKNPLRKLKEFLIARRLEEALSKRRILEIYLNVIEWGDGIYGAEAASRAYFSKSSRDLNIREAVLLAAMIPSPRRMTPSRVSGRLKFRFELILSRMQQYHHITADEYELARKEGEVNP
jgi:monofunctional biosynthetic peptidoglycan transglycosylase